MDARRAAEVRDAADRLRAVLARVEADGEWAAGLSGAQGAGAEARRRMIEAGEMARGVLDAPARLDGMAAMCGAHAMQTAGLRSSLAQVVGEKNTAAKEHSAYRDAREAEIVDLRHGMAILRARCRAPEPEPAADAGGGGGGAHAGADATPPPQPAAAGDCGPAAGASKEELVERVKDGERRLRFLDGPDTPSSARSINSKYASKFGAVVDHAMSAIGEGRDPAAEGPQTGVRKRGGQPGHRGVSNNDKPEGIFGTAVPCKCSKCSGTALERIGDCRKRAWDRIDSKEFAGLWPLNEGAKDMLRRCRVVAKMGGTGPVACFMAFLARVRCLECGTITKATTSEVVEGTALGAGGLSTLADYRRRMPDAEAADMLARHDGIPLGRTAIRTARFASTRRCGPAVAGFADRIAVDPWHLRDESEIKGSLDGGGAGRRRKAGGGEAAAAADAESEAPALDRVLAQASASRLQALLAVSLSCAYIRVAKGRSRRDIEEAFAAFLDAAFASDEYSGQTTGNGHVRQSDWVHLLRKAKMAAALAFFALYNRGLIGHQELCEYTRAAMEWADAVFEDAVRRDRTVVLVSEGEADAAAPDAPLALPAPDAPLALPAPDAPLALPAPAPATAAAAAAAAAAPAEDAAAKEARRKKAAAEDAAAKEARRKKAAAEDAAAKEARRKKAAESGMPELDAEKESLHHNEIIAYLMLVSLYRKICKMDTASNETVALLRERVEEILERYGEKHSVKTSFTNALVTLFAALSISGMPFETTAVERVVRDIVMVFKRLHRQIQSQEGADMASIEMSFCATCKMYGITPSEAILRILRDPEWTPIGAAPAPA